MEGNANAHCGSTKNLYLDHDIPFAKGGSSLTAVPPPRDLIAPRLAGAFAKAGCAKHNLEKSDKILSIAPWIFTGAATALHIQKLSD